MDKLLRDATEEELLGELQRRQDARQRAATNQANWPVAGGSLYVEPAPGHRFRAQKQQNWDMLTAQDAWHHVTIRREGKDAVIREWPEPERFGVHLDREGPC